MIYLRDERGQVVSRTPWGTDGTAHLVWDRGQYILVGTVEPSMLHLCTLVRQWRRVVAVRCQPQCELGEGSSQNTVTFSGTHSVRVGLQSFNVDVRPEPVLERLRTWGRTHPVWRIGVSALGLALLALTIAWGSQSADPAAIAARSAGRWTW